MARMIPRPDRLIIPPAGEILDYARRLGVRRTLSHGLYVMVNQILALSILDCVTLCRQDVNMALADSRDPFDCRFLEVSEMARLAGQLGVHAERRVREALARGDACHAVFDGEHVANIGFYANQPTPILNDLVAHFDRSYWYMYGALTPPVYRGRRLHALGVLRAALAFFDRQVPALVGVYERTNYRSMVSALRMGWQRSGTLYRVGIGPWMRLGRTAAARRIGMRLEPRWIEVEA